MTAYLKLVSTTMRAKFVQLDQETISKYHLDIMLSDIDESDEIARLCRVEDVIFFGDPDAEEDKDLICCLLQETEDGRFFARPTDNDPTGQGVEPCQYGRYFTDFDVAIREVGSWMTKSPEDLPIEHDQPLSRLEEEESSTSEETSAAKTLDQLMAMPDLKHLFDRDIEIDLQLIQSQLFSAGWKWEDTRKIKNDLSKPQRFILATLFRLTTLGPQTGIDLSSLITQDDMSPALTLYRSWAETKGISLEIREQVISRLFRHKR